MGRKTVRERQLEHVCRWATTAAAVIAPVVVAASCGGREIPSGPQQSLASQPALVIGSPGAPVIALNPTSVTFTLAVGRPPAAKTVAVTNGGTGTLSGLAVGPISSLCQQPVAPGPPPCLTNWLTASVSPVTAPATVTLVPRVLTVPWGRGAATYSGTVRVTSSARGVTNSPQLIHVTYVIFRQCPVPTTCM